MATLGEMATGVAHELNQPLGVIRMAASNCIKRLQKGVCDAEYLEGKFSRISEQTERASQIINHMRIFGRKADGQEEPFDLRDSVNEVAALARLGAVDQLRNDFRDVRPTLSSQQSRRGMLYHGFAKCRMTAMEVSKRHCQLVTVASSARRR